MKLHKLMYFAQRESLIQRDTPLFAATFYGWRFGPVIKELRSVYRDDKFPQSIPQDTVQRIKPVMDIIFEDYAERDSFHLSRLTHGEISWKKSRTGIPPSAAGGNAIALDDIRLDANRMKERRAMLDKLNLL